MPLWGIVSGLALVVVMAVGALALRPDTVSADPNRQPRPVPTFTFGQPQPELPSALFIGDSYTLGAGADSPDASYAHVAARELGWSVATAADANSGYLVEGDRGQTEASLIDSASGTYDYVILASGFNDYVEDFASYENVVRATVGQARAKFADATIVVMGVWTPNDQAYQPRFSAMLADIAEDTGALFVDPAPWFTGPDMLDPDGIHPNQAGHDQIGTGLAAALQATAD